MAKILEMIHVSPSTDSSNSLSEFSLPLTFFDTYLFKLPPVETLFFYSHPQPKQTLLNSTIPKLKHSLSLTLKHFLPLAGNLTWPQDSSNPIVLCTPNDGVLITVAEFNDANAFDLLSSNQVRKAESFFPLVPNLNVTKTGASIMALQITLFPDRGFCIGVTTHHALVDGKSASMFLKSWAHLSRSEKAAGLLPSDLTPFFDRSVIEDPEGLNMFFLKQWIALSGESNPKDCPNLFELLSFSKPSSDLVQGTFQLTKTDMSRLKEKVLSKWEKLELPTSPTITKPHLTSFVVTYAYVLVCLLKATEDNDEMSKKKVFFRMAADFRSRRPSIPENYFGNCVLGIVSHGDIREALKEDDSFTILALKICERIKEFEQDVKDGLMEKLPRVIPTCSKDSHIVAVAGSPRLGLYDTDFGWGKPKKVEIVSLDTARLIAMMESRDGNRGIEIALVLKKHQMDVFSSIFHAGVDQTLLNY